jgi:branched-chain amino acid transport system ATP-binding protein
VSANESPAAGTSTDGRLSLQGMTIARGGRDVVRDVTIDIPPGEITTLLGPNGAGKSSLVLAVGGVLRPRKGAVMLDGRDWAGRRPERIRHAGVAIVPEGRRLLPALTVEDNIRVAMYALPRSQAVAGRARALELFPELERLLGSDARSLSGGEQQMVVLAQALVSQPRFVLIDELSLGLAPVVVNRLIPTIREVAQSGIGVLLIEQFATVALGLATRAYVMEGGRLQFSGSARELKEDPSLLHSAYLLRGHTNGAPPASTAPSVPAGQGTPSAPAAPAGAESQTQPRSTP